MSRKYVVKGRLGDYYPILSSLAARDHYERNKDFISNYLWGSLLLFTFSPVFFFVALSFFLYNYRKQFHTLFFANTMVYSKYREFFMPMVDHVLFSAVGYRVYPEELEEHLYIINSNLEEDIEELKKKGAVMRKNLNRQFGFSVDALCRHLFYIGTTGSGKSETIMSFFTDVVRNGGGIGFLDGKSDITMEGRIYNLCKDNYYETQFNVINFTSPEKSPDSNTYSPLLSYPSAMKASEFLGEYIGGDGGGSGDYFANRSKVMLGNNVKHFKNRQYYYNENFSFSDVASSRNHVEMTYIYSLSYGICLEIEDVIKKKIAEDTRFKAFMNKTRGLKTPDLEEIENLELLYAYLNQNPTVIYTVERALDMKFDFIANYYILYSLIGEYITSISPSWYKYAVALSKSFVKSMYQDNRRYLYTHQNPVKIRDLRELYVEYKREIGHYGSLEQGFSEEPDIFQNLQEALGKTENSTEHLEKLNDTALQQHQYAVQGWDRVFDLFAAYQRIMGVVYPDVDGEDIISNNKVLFIMLPATELAPDLVEALGKLIILMFKNVASISLGGEKQSLMSVQFKIFQNKIKPNPIFLMVTDEIGSYMPKNGLSLIASQVRSLNISLIIAGQDIVSIEPMGADGKRERARLMANLAKIVLQTRDTDTEELQKLIPEVEVIETDGYMKSAVNDNKFIENTSASIKEAKVFDIGVATRFAKGFGAYIDGAKTEPVYFQSYYLGDNNTNATQIRKSAAFVNLYNEYEPEELQYAA